MNRKLALYAPCLLISLLIAVHIFFPNVEAVPSVSAGKTTITPLTPTKTNILVLEYSPGCQTALYHHMNTTCPSLDKIWKYDNTNKNISGKLVESNGYYYRSPPQIQNHYIWYGNQNKTICVSCDVPLRITNLVKTIWIESSDFKFVNKAETVTNNTYNVYSNPFISSDCMTATVGYSDILLGDTIHYMLNNCTGTHISNNQTKSIKDTPFDTKDTISLKQMAYNKAQLKSSKSNCISKKCDTPKDPFKKW